jgi:hypothetical protein
MKFMFRKDIPRPNKIPNWYGMAAVKYDADVKICYPVIINIFAAIFFKVRHWTKYPQWVEKF